MHNSACNRGDAFPEKLVFGGLMWNKAVWITTAQSSAWAHLLRLLWAVGVNTPLLWGMPCQKQSQSSVVLVNWKWSSQIHLQNPGGNRTSPKVPIAEIWQLQLKFQEIPDLLLVPCILISNTICHDPHICMLAITKLQPNPSTNCFPFPCPPYQSYVSVQMFCLSRLEAFWEHLLAIYHLAYEKHTKNAPIETKTHWWGFFDTFNSVLSSAGVPKSSNNYSCVTMILTLILEPTWWGTAQPQCSTPSPLLHTKVVFWDVTRSF